MTREVGMSSTPPQYFTCPISLELFRDPVTLCTGQTYDRFHIQKWFAAGNLTCPVTMQTLHDMSFVPNHTLTHLIHQWIQQGTHEHDQHDFCQVGFTLKNVLESEECTLQQKIEVLEKVGILSDDLCRENEGLIQMGFVSILLGLIFGRRITQEMMILVEKSLDCALKLMPFCSMKDLNMLLEESKFENFRVLFKDGSVLVKVRLCNLIEVIFTSPSSWSSSPEDEVSLASKIAYDSKLAQTLITLLQDYQQNYEVSEASMKAILSILSVSRQTYRENMVKEGLVQALVMHIVEVEGKEKHSGHKATKALELVLESESAQQILLANEVKNAVKALIKMVFRVSGDDECSESAVNCLMKLCCESTEAREAAICGGVLTQLLLLLQSQCGGSVKTRARMLLKLLRCMWVKDPKHV